MSLEVPITLAPRYSVSVSLASPTGGALELLPPQTAIVAELQPILRGERGLDGAPGQDGQDGADANLSADIHAAPAKASPDDADELGYLDSAGSWALVKATWAQLKAALKTSFDSTYLAKTGGTLSGALVGTQIGVVAGHYFYGSGGGANYFAGRDVLRISYGSVEIQNAALSLFDGTYRSYLQADGAANTLAQRNGTNAQTFRLYNTFTDSSNFERGFMRWAGNALEIGTEAGGTGTNRGLRLLTEGAKGISIDPANNLIFMAPTGGEGPFFGYRRIGFNGWNSGAQYSVFGPSDQAGNLNRAGSVVGIYPLGGSGNGAAGQVLLYASLGKASGTAGHTFEFGVKVSLHSSGSPGLQFGGETSSFPAIKRNASQLEFRLADDSGFASVSAATVKTQAFTVATLPSASSAGAGACAYVTDATASTFMSVVAGGGSNKVPVVSDGVNWLIG